MGFSGILCCFRPPEEAGTPRSDQEFEPEVAEHTPSAASCSTPAGPYKFIFDKDDAERVTGLNNSGRQNYSRSLHGRT
jgi:hypothetical protein